MAKNPDELEGKSNRSEGKPNKEGATSSGAQCALSK
jgi:hypothetical protein